MLLITAIFTAAMTWSCGKDEEPVIKVTGVTLSKTSLTLVEEQTENLSATVAPATATNKKVSWKSGNTAVATVDASGKVTTVKAGTATITATTEDGAKTAACAVTVTAKTVAVTGVTLNKTTLSLEEEKTETLTATVAPENATNKAVTWKSDKTDVATIDADGKITAVKAGSATITITTEDGAKTATCAVTVTAKAPETTAVTGVTLNKSSLALTIGNSESLTAAVAPADATNKNVTWKSDKTDIATVDADGKVTAVTAGTATITVTTEDGGKTATCGVTVSNIPPTSITLNKYTSTLFVGGSETLTATVAPSNATNKAVTWSSSKESVVTVDATGKVTAVGVGEAQIVATTVNPDIKAICNYTVAQVPKGTFSKDGIYYKAITEGGTDVEVTNKVYGASWGLESRDSYSGTVNVPATVEYEGVTYTVKRVGDRAFWFSLSLTEVILPEGITAINSHVFAGCESLTSVLLPNSLTIIGGSVFENCIKLPSLHIPANVSYIPYGAFVFCPELELTIAAGNTKYRVVDGALFELKDGNLDRLCWVPRKKTGEYIIPDGVAYIMGYAISYGNLTKVTIPASVNVFESLGFYYTRNLTDLVLHWADPSLCYTVDNPSENYFIDMNYASITLHVPAGTKALYEAHPLWGLGFKIVED